MRFPPENRDWRRVAPRALKALPLLQPTKLAGCLAIAALNILWHGHGVLRSLAAAPRFASVLVLSYAVITIAEFLWLMVTVPQPVDLGFPERHQVPAAPEIDPLVAQIQGLPRAELKHETLQLAEEMRIFEAGSDRAYVSTLIGPPAPATLSDEERDRQLDRQSTELVQRHFSTWRVYRDRFYRPARAFRDELRQRLGIRNPQREPEIPALDQAALTGAKPITEAADYLTELANRLR